MKFLKKLLPLLFLSVLLLVYFWPSLTGGTFISTGMIYSDLMSFNYPLKDWYHHLLISGQMPLWTNLIGSGYPVFAEGQLGVLYPVHLLLFRLLPTLLAFNLNLYLHFLLAAVATFLFCRISLKRSISASLLAGLAYSFCGFNFTHLHQVNIILVIAYLPLLLLLIERFVTTGRFYWIFILSFALALQVLAGFMQLFYYTSLVSIAFFILIAYIFPVKKDALVKQKNLKLLMAIIFAFILSVGITVIQILPTMELTKFSQRSAGINFEVSATTVWPVQALSLFINPKAYDIYLPTPDFHPLNPDSINYNVLYGYVGIIPLILAGLAIILGRKNRFVIIFTLFLIASFIFAFGSSTQLFTIIWTVIPGMSFFREPVKILFLIDFCLAILAAFGLDLLLNSLLKKPRIINILSILLVLLTFLDLYFNNASLQPIIAGQDWFKMPETANFLQKELKNNYFRYYSCGTGNFDYLLTKDTAVQKELQNTLIADFNQLYNIPSSQEWVGLFFKPMMDLNEKGIKIDIKNQTVKVPPEVKKSLQLQDVKYYICSLPIDDKELKLVKQIPLSKSINQIFFLDNPQGVQKAVIPTKTIYIYEYHQPLPRAWLVFKSQIIKDQSKILESILNENFDPRKEVVLEKITNDKFQISNKLPITNYQRITRGLRLRTIQKPN